MREHTANKSCGFHPKQLLQQHEKGVAAICECGMTHSPGRSKALPTSSTLEGLLELGVVLDVAVSLMRRFRPLPLVNRQRVRSRRVRS